METNRNGLIDFSKGLLILGVIWGHTITALKPYGGAPVWILTFFRTYDMPFFMIIAGYLLRLSSRKRDSISLFLSKVGGILVPLLIWEVLIGVCGPLWTSVKNIFSLWYLWSYFGCASIIIAVNFVIKNQKLRTCAHLSVIVFLHILPFEAPFNLGYMYPFICIGYYLEQLKETAKKHKSDDSTKIFVAVFAFFVFLLCFWENRYNVWNVGSSFILASGKQYLIILFRSLIGIVGCFCMWYVFKMLYETFPEKIKGYFLNAGKNSMMIYILQAIIIEHCFSMCYKYLVDKLGYNPLTENSRLLGYILAPTIALLTIFISCAAVTLIKKIPYAGKALTGFRITTKSK